MKRHFLIVLLLVLVVVPARRLPAQVSPSGSSGGVTLVQVTNVVTALGGSPSIKLGSPAGGNNAFNDMRAATPLSVGQMLSTWYNGKQAFLWSANGTTAGAYTNSVNFATGIGQIGDVSAQGVMDPGVFQTRIAVAGNPARWDIGHIGDDTGVIITSGNTYGSGEQLMFSIVYTNGAGVPQVQSDIDVALAFVQTNSLPGLLPGWLYTVQNYRLNQNMGFAVANTSVPGGFANGNYAQTFWDINSQTVYFPVFQSGQWDPRYAGFKASSINNLTGAANFIGVTTLSNLQVTAGETITGGVLSGNGAGLTNSAHAVLSAGSMTSMAQAATASSEYAPWFWNATAATTINNNKFRVPYGGFLTNFWVEDDTGLGVGTNSFYTIFTNGVACNLNATATGGGTAVGFSTSNLTTSVFIPAGTYLHFNMSNACPSAPANQLMNWSVELAR